MQVNKLTVDAVYALGTLHNCVDWTLISDNTIVFLFNNSFFLKILVYDLNRRYNLGLVIFPWHFRVLSACQVGWSSISSMLWFKKSSWFGCFFLALKIDIF